MRLALLVMAALAAPSAAQDSGDRLEEFWMGMAQAAHSKASCEKVLDELLRRHGAEITGAWALGVYADGRYEAKVYVPAIFSTAMDGRTSIQEFRYRGTLEDGKVLETRLTTLPSSSKAVPSKAAEGERCRPSKPE